MSRWERLAPLTGVVFIVLGLVANLVIYPGSAPDFVDEPAKIVAFYEDDPSAIMATGMLNLIGSFFLLWFLGSLRSVLRRAETAEGRVSAIAFAGGTAGVALLLAAASVDLVAALRVDEQDQIDPAVATALWDISLILFGAAATMAFAVLLVATGVVILRTRTLPVWLGWVSLVIGIGLAIPPISFFVFFGFLAWVLITSVVLYLAAEKTQPIAPEGNRA